MGNTNVQTCLVIGGSGFLGHNLAQGLLQRGCRVRILDYTPPKTIDPKVDFFQGDIRNLQDIIKACQGVDVVFHAASVIITDGFIRHQAKKHLFDINVLGTQNVIQACLICDVKKLIYTSSNNVVFDKAIENGDERLPYAKKFIDYYTKTKVIAEKTVLSANSPKLLTCALRPGGIYGPGDKVILPRLVEALKKGQLLFFIGSGKALADNVYIDNLVSAHLLAADKLTPHSTVQGQAYFISDDEPCNYFDFLKPVIHEMGFQCPAYSIPFSVIYPITYVLELLHSLYIPFKPYMTRMELQKLALSNYFNIAKARRDLGYAPLVSQKEGIAASLPYCKELFEKLEIVKRPHIGWWISVLMGMTILAILAFHTDFYTFFTSHINIPSQLALQWLTFAAVSTHAAEAFYSLRLAKKAGLKSTCKGWCFQTFLLGYPSLRLLRKRVKQGIQP